MQAQQGHGEIEAFMREGQRLLVGDNPVARRDARKRGTEDVGNPTLVPQIARHPPSRRTDIEREIEISQDRGEPQIEIGYGMVKQEIDEALAVSPGEALAHGGAIEDESGIHEEDMA